MTKEMVELLKPFSCLFILILIAAGVGSGKDSYYLAVAFYCWYILRSGNGVGPAIMRTLLIVGVVALLEWVFGI